VEQDEKQAQRDELLQKVKKLDAEVVDWTDLINQTENGNFVILDTANRAITLDQLDLVVIHMKRRVASEHMWVVKKYPGPTEHLIQSPEEVNLYHVNAKIILPSTAEQNTSLVELMSDEEQPPDYFTSHYWGEPVLQMVLCLKQHSHDRGLTSKSGYLNGEGYGGTMYEDIHKKAHPGYLHGRSPRYWVCAYANRQGDLGAEIDVPLMETSFVRALKLCKGTVSVLDHGGVVFTRVWCIYELYHSLPLHRDAHAAKNYTYDMYTALNFEKAVGISDGQAAVDLNADDKLLRERTFPLRLVDQGLSIECRKSNASREDDRSRILAEIGDKHEALDCVLHGVVAKAGIAFAMESCHAMEHGVVSENLLDMNVSDTTLCSVARDPFAFRAQYLEALRKGSVRKINLDLKGSLINSDDLVDVISTLNPDSIRLLTISRAYKASGPWLQGLSNHTFHVLERLDLSYCESLEELPEGLWEAIPNVETICLEGCNCLHKVPPHMKQLLKLKQLDLTHAVFCPCKPNTDMGQSSHVQAPRADMLALKKQGCEIDCGFKVY